MRIPKNRKNVKKGTIFNNWTVLDSTSFSSTKNGKTRSIWLLKCVCGKHLKRSSSNIVSGKSRSCGCQNVKTLESSLSKYFSSYKADAKKRNYIFDISFDFFKEMVSRSCYYCGELPSARKSNYSGIPMIVNGIDRKDNTLGYTEENCVPCCSDCNQMKMDLTVEQFFYKVKRIAARHISDDEENIGDILLEMETVLDKMCNHGLQLGDIHSVIHQHIWTHRMDAVETYTDDNSRPLLKYGHKDQI